MNKSILSISLSLILSGCVITNQDEIKDQPCFVNFIETGSIATGKTYSTEITLDVNKKKAFENAKIFVLNDGWNLSYYDEEKGIINANKGISFTSRSTPLSVKFDNDKSKTKLKITYETGFGVYTPTNMLKSDFCEMTSFINK